MSDKKGELKRDGAMQILSKEGETTQVESGKMDEPPTKKSKTTLNETGEEKTTKRISTTARTTKEGEELLKDMGHKDVNPESDRRRTRSQTRGVPPPPPLAPRKERVKNTANKSDGTKSRGRGRPKKSEKREEVSLDAGKEENSGKKDETSEENKEAIKENKGDDNGAKKVENDTSEPQSQKSTSPSTTEKAVQDN